MLRLAEAPEGHLGEDDNRLPNSITHPVKHRAVRLELYGHAELDDAQIPVSVALVLIERHGNPREVILKDSLANDPHTWDKQWLAHRLDEIY